ncbi:MAG: hypothetical protein LE178_02030, partial [Endomicrobium sp.]|nr:hypothetical protein [Endomicrobium sp.]
DCVGVGGDGDGIGDEEEADVECAAVDEDGGPADAMSRLAEAAENVVNPHIVTEDEDSTMSKFGNHTAESYLLGVTLTGFLFE